MGAPPPGAIARAAGANARRRAAAAPAPILGAGCPRPAQAWPAWCVCCEGSFPFLGCLCRQPVLVCTEAARDHGSEAAHLRNPRRRGAFERLRAGSPRRSRGAGARLFSPPTSLPCVTWLGATHPPPKRTSRGHARGTLPTPWAGKGCANQRLFPRSWLAPRLARSRRSRQGIKATALPKPLSSAQRSPKCPNPISALRSRPDVDDDLVPLHGSFPRHGHALVR
jgi:hypothetical protein